MFAGTGIPDRACRVAFALSLVLVLCPAPPGGAQAEKTVASHADASEFFNNVKRLCGQRYAGKAVFTPTPEDPMAQARLVMQVEACTPGEIRIPFHVGENRSRTWVLRWSQKEGLEFRHEHRHEDGTLDPVTNYGGWAAPFGTAWRQSFPADGLTANLIPAAKTNVWTLEIERQQEKPVRFVYDLKRDGKPRFRAVFDTTKPLP
jgi:hypothetical protein